MRQSKDHYAILFGISLVLLTFFLILDVQTGMNLRGGYLPIPKNLDSPVEGHVMQNQKKFSSEINKSHGQRYEVMCFKLSWYNFSFKNGWFVTVQRKLVKTLGQHTRTTSLIYKVPSIPLKCQIPSLTEKWKKCQLLVKYYQWAQCEYKKIMFDQLKSTPAQHAQTGFSKKNRVNGKKQIK